MRTLVLLALAGVPTAHAKEGADPTKPGAAGDKVAALRAVRIATLKDAAEISLKLAQHARIEFREALDDRVALLTAELDAAETESKRAALRKEALDSLKEYEELAQALVQSGRGTKLNVLRLKARRLEVEMQLEQAKANTPK